MYQDWKKFLRFKDFPLGGSILTTSYTYYLSNDWKKKFERKGFKRTTVMKKIKTFICTRS